MKKILVILLALIMCLSVCACGEKEEPSKTPLADKLEANYNEDPADAIAKREWLMYSWFIQGIESFKNPASVELTGTVYYVEDETTNETKFFLIETRAENSFGGKTVGYVKVTSTSLTEVKWEPAFVNAKFEGEKVWKSLSGSVIADAVAEYISLNYQ